MCNDKVVLSVNTNYRHHCIHQHTSGGATSITAITVMITSTAAYAVANFCHITATATVVATNAAAVATITTAADVCTVESRFSRLQGTREICLLLQMSLIDNII